jgi:ParB family transcriptional regulator, chromosome partitioning protein
MSSYDKILATAMAKQGRNPIGKSQDSTLPLEQIETRIGGDTRPLNQGHVEALAESIAVVGLIEPLVVDIKGRLLAGGHRRAAISLLKEEHADKYQKHFPNERVPVRIMPFDSEEEPDLALQIEIAENEQRRDYTPAEVRALANRLREAGYVETKGRPGKRQKALRPALEVIIGKSLRTVRRYLNEGGEEQEKSRTDDRLFPLRQVRTKLKKWQHVNPETSAEKILAEQLPEILQLIESVLNGESE